MPRRVARSVLSLSLVVVLAAQGLVAPAARAAAPGAPEVTVGAAGAFSRIELHGAVVRRDGDDVVARFPHGGRPDIARLHVRPPPHLGGAQVEGEAIRFTPAPGSQARFGVADGVNWINFAAAPAPAAPTPAATAPTASDAAPASGVVRMGARLQGATLTLSFPWRTAPGAAVFRRGPAVWMVFDAPARLDLSAAPHGLPQAKSFTVAPAQGATALRIVTAPGVAVRAQAQGPVWTVSLGPQALAPDAVEVTRAPGSPSALEAQLPGATRALWIADPVVGDRIAAVAASGPPSGVAAARAFVEGTVLASAQGVAVQPAVDDLSVAVTDGRVRIGRPRGLALSTAAGQPSPTAVQAGPDLPAAASLPALVDPAWGRTAPGGFVARYDELLAGAARETAAGRDAGVEARLGLARFLVGSDLAFEAIGVLDSLLKASPALAQDAGFRGLRGAARAMAGRWRDAEADFSTAATADDPSSALWRGYADAQTGDVQGARQQFARGRSAASLFPDAWRARFARADAETALAAGDLAAARTALQGDDGAPPPDEAAGLVLARARLAEASGQPGPALALYRSAAGSTDGAVAAPARLAVLRLRLAAHAVTPAAAADELDSLRFLWRGDATEIEVIRQLGRLDIAQGRYREALEALRSAGSRLPDLPASAGLRDDLAGAFRTLFVDGRADGMEPVQQLALFYDFKELTPIGADGDLMVRKLVRRLVDVDLLDQAGDLLKYQVDNRLQGVAKAQVAADLAGIELLAGKPEAAIDAVEGSRSTLLPTTLNAQRRLLEARALVMLGRYDHALELVGTDGSADALEIRMDAAWKARDWPAAGRLAEARLGERWRSAAPLTPTEAALLVRAGSAFTLARDDAGLTRLRGRFGALAAANPQHDALGVALAGLGGEGAPAGVAPGALARATLGDADALAGWVARMRGRLSEVGSLTPAPPPPSTVAAARGPASAGRA